MESAKINASPGQLDLTDPSPAERVAGVPLLMDLILKDVPTPDLLTLRSVSQAWNESALRLLKKRADLFIKLSASRLLHNDPDCFEEEDRKFFLREVRVWFCKGAEARDETLKALHRFFQKHHQDILDLRVAVVEASGDFLPDLWNRFEFSRLEKVDICKPLTFTNLPLPPLVPKKAVKKLGLASENEMSLALANRLISAAPNLRELKLLSDKIPDLSLLATRSLRLLHIGLPSSSRSLRDQTLQQAAEILNTFFLQHGQGVEDVILNFYRGLNETGEIVLESPMPKLESLCILIPAALKNFGPKTLPALKDLKLSLYYWSDSVYANQEERFEKLTSILIIDARVLLSRKLEKLLSLGGTAQKVTVLPTGFRPDCHPSAVNASLFNSLLTSYNCKNLKKLDICMGFDVEVVEGIETCSNIEDVEEQMRKIRRLVAKGLECLTLRTIRTGDWRDRAMSCVVGDWGPSFACELLSLAKKLKHVSVLGPQPVSLFSPDLEHLMRRVIAQDSLPLDAKWRNECRIFGDENENESEDESEDDSSDENESQVESESDSG